MKKGYIAAVLDEDFREDLLYCAEPAFDRLFCKHITMAYNPSDEVFKKYEHLLGQKVEVLVTKLYKDDHCQAAVVTGVPSENEVPHITLSCAEGVKPSYSNTMLKNPNSRWEFFGMDGHATVQFVQHQGSQ